MDTSRLSTYRWTWPWSGVMFVVVALTICAPVRVSTTWTLVPVTLSPDVGLTIATTAGEDGRLPDAVGADAPALAAGALAGDALHAATIAVRSATASDLDRILVITALPLDRGIDMRSRTLPQRHRSVHRERGSPLQHHEPGVMTSWAWTWSPAGAVPTMSNTCGTARTVTVATTWPGSSVRTVNDRGAPAPLATVAVMFVAGSSVPAASKNVTWKSFWPGLSGSR